MATIQLPSGVINAQALSSGNTYVGAGKGKTIIQNRGTTAFSHTVTFNGHRDIVIQDLTLDGNGAKGDNTRNITFKRVAIVNCLRKQDDHQGINMANIDGLVLEEVDFINCNYAFILNGLVKNVRYTGGMMENNGIHGKAALSNGSGNIVIEKVIRRLARTGYYFLEFQPSDKLKSDQIHDIICRNCADILPVVSGVSNSGSISFPLEKATGVKIYGNYVDGTRQDGVRGGQGGGYKGPSMVFELGGVAGEVSDNWVQYCNDPLSVNLISQNCKAYNNRVIKCNEPMNMQGGAPNGSNTFTNNHDQVTLPTYGGWTLLGISSGSDPVPPPIDPCEAKCAALESALALEKQQHAADNEKNQETIDALNVRIVKKDTLIQQALEVQ